MRNTVIKRGWGIAILGLLYVSAYSQKTTAGDTRPNILVILADDMGYSDIGCFGAEVSTPHIDQLAAEGLRFTHFYNTSRCSPSRASLLTGLYPHQAGMGFLSSTQYKEEGYRDDLSRNAVTMAEVFKASGYNTYMTGKWHVCKDIAPDGDQSNWPVQRGFQRFFGTLNGAGSFYDPATLVSNNKFIAPGANFYYTDAISDTAVRFIHEHPKDKPFFFYVSYTTAHWPLHAPEEEIQKSKGQYDKGWDIIRQQRFEKQKALGIIPDNCVLSDRSPEIPSWEDETMKEWQARRMEVYAAMIRIMDSGIGRIVGALKEEGLFENTIIFYMHDNGGCAEPQDADKLPVPLTEEQKILRPFSYDSVFYGRRPEYSREGHFIRRGKGIMPGGPDTWVAYGEEWANVSNTPFRLYKHYTHEGGIASPLIVAWPGHIKDKGALRRQNSHLIDIMATCLDITGCPYPQTFNGYSIQPFEGNSLVPAFTGQAIKRKYIFWEHEGNRAIRLDNWKLVSKTKQGRKFTEADEHAWELYDTDADPAETKDLASVYPDMVRELSAAWEKEAFRTKAKPWPWGRN